MAGDWKEIEGDSQDKYSLYLCSREWGLKRRAVRRRANGLCERCQKHDIDAVHHLSYQRLYGEQLSDLIGLCRGCHDFIHGNVDTDPTQLNKRVAERALDLNSFERRFERPSNGSCPVWCDEATWAAAERMRQLLRNEKDHTPDNVTAAFVWFVEFQRRRIKRATLFSRIEPMPEPERILATA